MRALSIIVAVMLVASPAFAQEIADDQIAGWSDAVLDDIQGAGPDEIEQRVTHCYGEVYGGRSDLVEECTTMHFTAAIIEHEMARAMNSRVRDLYRNEVMAGVIATHFERAGKSVDYRNAFSPRALEIIYARIEEWIGRQ